MNKSEMIAKVAESVGISKTAATDAVNTVISSIKDVLKEGGQISLSGLGNFSVKQRGARKGRNPQTGEEIEISAKNVIKFSAGKDLKDAVN